jgi:serine/threonine protein kinase
MSVPSDRTASWEGSDWVADFEKLCLEAKTKSRPLPRLEAFLSAVPTAIHEGLKPHLESLLKKYSLDNETHAPADAGGATIDSPAAAPPSAPSANLRDANATVDSVPAPIPKTKPPTSDATIDSPADSKPNAQGATIDSPPEDPNAATGMQPQELTESPEGESSKPLDSVIGSRIAGYLILSELGKGAMGVVYKARQHRADRIVALKMVLAGALSSQKHLDRFAIEARAVGQLQHPNIVQIFDIGEWEGMPYFSLEFVKGGSLQQRLDRKPQTPQFAASMSEKLARAMGYAHGQNVLHRDLKPANILVSVEGEPKIADFGLAKQLEQDSGATVAGTIMGTPNYMAPEQARGDSDTIGPAADQYSLGVILYEMLTGRVPFIGTSMYETLQMVREREPTPPSEIQPGIPKDLETICLKCLQKEPEKRYADCLAFADDLRRFQNNEPILARPISSFERLIRWCRRNPRVAGLLVTSFLLLIAVAGVSLFAAININEARKEEEKQRKFAQEQQKKAEDSLKDYRKVMSLVSTDVIKQLKSAIYTRAIQGEIFKSLQTLVEDSGKTPTAAINQRAKLRLLQNEAHELSKARKIPEARAKLQEIVDIAQTVADQETVEIDLARGNLAAAMANIGEFEREYRQWDTSFEWFAKALKIQRDLLADPKTTEYTPEQLKSFVANSLQAQSLARLGANQLKDAKQFALDARQLREAVIAKSTTTEELGRLSSVCNLLSLIETRLDDDTAAAKESSRSVEVRRKMLELEPNNLEFKLELSKQLGRHGDCLLFTDQPDKAKTAYEESIKLADQLARPAELQEIKRQQSGDLYKSGVTHLRLGLKEEAKKRFEACFQLRDEFNRANPSFLPGRIEYMFILARMGKVKESTELADRLANVSAKIPKADSGFFNYPLRAAFAFGICSETLDTTRPLSEWSEMQKKEREALRDTAFRWLNTALERGYKDYHELETNPDADPLRGDSRFQEMVEKLKKLGP